jgi:Ca2+-binding RTX toxin-like protein
VGSVAHPARLGVVVTLDDVADDGIAVPGHAATEDDNAHSDIENIFGSTGPDRLYGTEVYNFIQGRDGDDLIVIDQGGDVDSALGGVGDDTIHARDGLEDYVNCDPGEDTFVGDAIDTASRCETMDLG